MTLGVVARIHWQALRLWFKRVPFFRKPAPPADVRHPIHPSSLTTAMNTTTAPHASSLAPQRPAAPAPCCSCCERLRHGTLTLQLPDGSHAALRHGDAARTPACMLHNWKVFGAALKSGDIGFAESFIAGDWSTPNLTELLRLFVRNRQEMEDVIYGSWLGRLFYRVKHLLQPQHPGQQPQEHPRPLRPGQCLLPLWLDETMNYSSAWFEGDLAGDMAQAQKAKVRRALRMAGVQPGDRVLEIGCGWGALAEMATTEFGASHGRRHAEHRAAGLGAGAHGTSGRRARPAGPTCACRTTATSTMARLTPSAPSKWSRPWAANTGRTYFQTRGPPAQARRPRLRPEHRDRRRAVRALHRTPPTSSSSTSFPAAACPARREFRRQAAGGRPGGGGRIGLRPGLRRDAAALARSQFLAERSRMLQLGFDERFMRIWEFYLAYCEAAFDEANIDVVQYTLRKA